MQEQFRRLLIIKYILRFLRAHSHQASASTLIDISIDAWKEYIDFCWICIIHSMSINTAWSLKFNRILDWSKNVNACVDTDARCDDGLKQSDFVMFHLLLPFITIYYFNHY